MGITAQKIRNIQMLNIRELPDHVSEMILEQAITGKEEYITTPMKLDEETYQRLTDNGFKVRYDDRICEYKISWGYYGKE